MNRQTTYFLQRVLSGLATSVIYAAFDSYRYNERQRVQYNRRPNSRNKRIGNGPSYYNTKYDRKNRYK